MAIQKKGDTWKLKKWFAVYAPKQFKDVMIGEMPANDEKSAMGRNIEVGLDLLTKNPSHAYTNVTLKVTGVEGVAAHTTLVSMRQLYSYIRSLVRAYKSIANAVIPITTKDGRKLVLKMLVITRARSTNSRISGIRKEMTTHLLNYSLENNADDIITAVIEGKLQAETAAKIRHIAPISKVEVRALEVKS